MSFETSMGTVSDPFQFPEEEDYLLPEFSDAEWERELDRAFSKMTAPIRIERGIGICGNHKCNSFLKAVFLLYHEGDFFCQECDTKGTSVAEKGIPYRRDREPFAEIRVEYSYDPAKSKYTEIAVLKDESWIGEYATYTLQDPLISTSKHAFRKAESMLRALNDKYIANEDLATPPRFLERVVDLGESMEEVKAALSRIETELAGNDFLNK